jgi:hypothetical protein
VYELTDRGLELESVLQAIGRWGVESPRLPDSATVSADTFVLGLRAHFDSTSARGLSACYELWIGEDVFTFEVRRRKLSVRRGQCQQPQLVLNVDTHAMVAVSRGRRPLASSLSTAGGSQTEGVGEFARLFLDPQTV